MHLHTTLYYLLAVMSLYPEEGRDYEIVNKTLIVIPSVHHDCVTVIIKDDNIPEPSELFQVSLAGQTLTQGERVWGHSHSKVVQSLPKKIQQLKWAKWLLSGWLTAPGQVCCPRAAPAF